MPCTHFFGKFPFFGAGRKTRPGSTIDQTLMEVSRGFRWSLNFEVSRLAGYNGRANRGGRGVWWSE